MNPEEHKTEEPVIIKDPVLPEPPAIVDTDIVLGEVEPEAKSTTTVSIDPDDGELADMVKAISELRLAFSLIAKYQKLYKRLAPTVQDAFLEHLSHLPKSISGIGPGVSQPYYKEAYALQMAAMFDRIAADKSKDLVFRFVDYPGVAKATLYLRINQAKNYLLRHLDPDGKYKQIVDNLSVTRELDCVRICYTIVKTRPCKPLRPLIGNTVDAVRSLEWKQKLQEWVETAIPGQVFESKNIGLTNQDIMWVRDMISDINAGDTLDPFSILKLNDTQIKIYKGKLPSLA